MQDKSLKLALTSGEYRAASFLVIADADLASVLPVPSDLISSVAEESMIIPAAQIDIRIVKHWYQAAHLARNAFIKPLLVPELLLKDDALIKVESEKNYLRLVSDEYIDISRRAKLSGRGVKSAVDEMPVQDAIELQPVDIIAGTNRQFWVTVKVPEAAVPGIYNGNIELVSGDISLGFLPIELEVLPFKLAPSMLVYSIFHRARLDDRKPEGTISSELRSEAQYSAELNNLVAHGITQPNLYQKHNSQMFRRALELRREAGIDQRELFLIGLPAVPGEGNTVPAGFGNYVRDTTKKVRPYGVEQLYVWGRDEAKADRLIEQEKVWAYARELGAKVFVAGYHTTGVTGPGNFDLMGPLHDTFVAINPVTREESARWHGIGKRILSYQNPTGGMERPLTFRQNLGLYLWQMNYDGAMPYAYQDSFGNSWNDFDHKTYRDHNFVYPTVDGVIDTMQWEGLREGVTDVRYLSTLFEAMEISTDMPLLDEINLWLAQVKEQPLARLNLDSVRDTFAGYVLALSGESFATDALAISKPIFLSGANSTGPLIRWQTSERVAAELHYGSSPDANDYVVRSSALRLDHELPIELLAGERLYFKVIADPQGQALVSETESFENAGQLEVIVNVVTSERSDLLDIRLVSSSPAHTIVDVDDSLLGWWRFAEGNGSESENSYGPAGSAKLTGDASWVSGYMNSGLELDGSGDFAYISDVEVPAGSPVTIEAWIKFNEFALQRGVPQGIFTGLYQHQINNHFYFKGTGALFELSSLLKPGVWQHVVLTHTGTTSSAVIYIDGQPVQVSANKKAEALDAIDGFGIGRSSGFFGGLLSGGSTQLDGAIDEVRIWNRVLSDAEVQAAFSMRSGDALLRFPAKQGVARNYRVISVNEAGEQSTQTITI
ncbi:MAG: LamG domain-containing protein, partial [Gammaproteobacteria bacterium]|nr:LamG domain-containing protein [Gammaproteobacteria bacterium]